MKLLKREVDALLSEMLRMHRKETEKNFQKIKKSKSVILEAKRYVAILSKIPANVRNKAYIDKNQENFAHSIAKLKSNEQPFLYEQWQNKIILTASSVKDMAELKKVLKINL